MHACVGQIWKVPPRDGIYEGYDDPFSCTQVETQRWLYLKLFVQLYST